MLRGHIGLSGSYRGTMMHSYCSAYPALGLSMTDFHCAVAAYRPTAHGIDCADRWRTTVLAPGHKGHLLIVDQLTHTEQAI
jgi:hypothetical protein